MRRGELIKRPESWSSMPRSAHASSTTFAGVTSAGEGSVSSALDRSARSTTVPASRFGDLYSPLTSSSRSPAASSSRRSTRVPLAKVSVTPALSHCWSPRRLSREGRRRSFCSGDRPRHKPGSARGERHAIRTPRRRRGRLPSRPRASRREGGDLARSAASRYGRLRRRHRRSRGKGE